MKIDDVPNEEKLPLDSTESKESVLLVIQEEIEAKQCRYDLCFVDKLLVYKMISLMVKIVQKSDATMMGSKRYS